MDLFKQSQKDYSEKLRPLADRMRPGDWDTFEGQRDLAGPDGFLRNSIERGHLFSIIFWGPPGSGKTTLARIIAEKSGAEFHSISAVSSGVDAVRKITGRAKIRSKTGRPTILFIDEIHRFNKAQQDALLHSVENGTIILMGATTENPSFEVISPLLSRCRVLKLDPLTEDEMERILTRALTRDPIISAKNITFEHGVKELIIKSSNGDARIMLNVLELASNLKPTRKGKTRISKEDAETAIQKRTLIYDKMGDYHYDTISAFIKSIRGSDPDAALYWLARMIESGEDPKFIARRMIIIASEDIGNADPHALTLATSAFTAVDYIGMPEAKIVLAQAAAYLASAPKSNSSYLAIEKALEEVKAGESHKIPMHLRNPVTNLMRDLKYGKGYKYPHEYPEHFTEQNYLPEKIKDKIFYHPSDQGYEKIIFERLRKLWKKRRKKFNNK
ncbi:MAG: replication-associated recombination protein A [Fidelibacterota bacterium]